MKNGTLANLICIDHSLVMPKYMQIARFIKRAIETGLLQKDDPMPSLSKLAEEIAVKRYTVELSYKYLKESGMLRTWPGKGYFVSEIPFSRSIRIFLLLNKLSDYKKVLYDNFVATLGSRALVDLQVYYNDTTLFEKLIAKAGNEYTHYVIMAHFNEPFLKQYELINHLPKHKLILLDRKIDQIKGNYGGVYENFKEDIYQSLQKLLKLLSKFHTINLLLPYHSYYPDQLTEGFISFCQDYAFDRNVLIVDEFVEVNKGEVFICLKDTQLLLVIEKMKTLNFVAGKDIGIISYNETPVKKYILEGITTISTDSGQMGIEAAHMILQNYRKQITLKCEVNLRKSL